mmetsp:Transcript_43701/g.68329  ORF Transcript_43701/g.68329 Transcript_43701/m.68329 type:complete len:183 (-) Transcript_43701:284-832(-)
MSELVNQEEGSEGSLPPERENENDNEQLQISEEEARSLTSELKAQGNAAFSAQDYEEAIRLYTEAIKVLKKVGAADHIILGNRSASFLALKRYVPALRDAYLASEEAPEWWKAHWRAGLALMGMVPKKFRTEQAIKAFETCEGLPDFPADKRGELAGKLAQAQARLEQQESEVSMPENCLLS